MDRDGPAEVRRLDLDGVVEVLCVIGVDRDDVASAQVVTPIQVCFGHLSPVASGLLENRLQESLRQPVLVDDCQHVDSGCS